MIDKVGNKCCGCSACINSCPKKCISMISNTEGFIYPSIDMATCINCGLCEEVCPVLHVEEFQEATIQESWGAVAKDKKLLLESSSGGLFTVLAREILAQNGCVFGATFSENYKNVTHIMIENENDLSYLRGSKYLQSDMKTCFIKTKQVLSAGKKVLFSGTPCQIAGLKAFLGKEYSNLYCVDIICHGVPSPALWQKYLEYVESKLGGEVSFVSFRNKENGWHDFCVHVNSGGKLYSCSHEKDPYFKMFLKNYCLRESCYQCEVKASGFFSDLTIGDFWGVEHVASELSNDLGVSLVLLHTEKGKELFNSVLPMLKGNQTDWDLSVKYNSAVNQSVKRPKERDLFFADMQLMDWNKLEKKYTTVKLKTRIRKMISASALGKLKRSLLH